MNKRANRVYWLLFIMMLIIGIAIGIDGIRAEKHSNETDEINSAETIAETKAETNTEESTEETTDEDDYEDSEATTIDAETANKLISEFYDGQVFIGDSIMSGFAKYATSLDSPEWLNNIIFLAQLSMGISSALDDDGPMYQGETRSVCDSVAMIQPDRIFINLGINEMQGLGSPGYSIEKLTNKYEELITAIKSASPESTIYVISITPCTEESETTQFNNDIISEFNEALEECTADWGVEYLDFASEFGDALDSEYAADFVHHNNTSYSEKWVPFFEKLALENSVISE